MSWLIDRFQDFNEKASIISNDKVYTYKEFFDEVQGFIESFKGKIKKSEVVAILGDYSFENIALLLALYQNKNIIVPITSTKENEINKRLKEANVDKVIKIGDKVSIKILPFLKKHQFIQKLQQENKSGLILFSSGSTGHPKAMIRNFDNLVD